MQGPAHQVTNTYEATRDVLLTKTNTRVSDNSVISSIDYTVNNIGQRTNANRGGAATNSTAWTYDALGQLVSADDSNNTQDRAYQYDGIGNREKSANSLTLPSSNNYIVNALNQYTAIDAIIPSYDNDGNATSYPLPANVSANSTLVWDAENRMISAAVSGGSTATYHYDAQSRRIAETMGSATTFYVYQGWNCIAEYTGSTPALAKTQLWGLDLSGTLQGAGGVGGLLSITDHISPITQHYPIYDGNGNITEYIDESETIVAHYEYDPFGTTTVASGTKANDFAYRFSTKSIEASTGLYYYGYRWYDPHTGRWPSRDPIAEMGGVNLYGFVRNKALTIIDTLGLFDFPPSYPGYHPPIEVIEPLPPPAENNSIGYCAAWASVIRPFAFRPAAPSSKFAEQYPQRFPNTFAAAMSRARKELESRFSCASGPIYNGDKKVLEIYGHGTGESPMPPGAKTEKDYGDNIQTPLQSALFLGNYDFHLNNIEYSVVETKCCYCYIYSAKLSLKDTLGIDSANVDGFTYPVWWLVFGPEREHDAAVWEMNGIKCCKK